MIIQMSNKEFQEVRKFIMGLKNPKVTEQFNGIFAKNSTGEIRGFVNPLNKDIVIEISENSTFAIESVLVKYSPDIAKLIKGGSSITNAPKWLSFAKNIFTDMAAAISKK